VCTGSSPKVAATMSAGDYSLKEMVTVHLKRWMRTGRVSTSKVSFATSSRCGSRTISYCLVRGIATHLELIIAFQESDPECVQTIWNCWRPVLLTACLRARGGSSPAASFSSGEFHFFGYRF